MTTYTKITDYAAKDALLTGNPFKVVRGTEIDAEFTSIASADATNLKNGGALGTPSSGTVTNLTGTASININGTVGATTRNTGSFTTAWADTQMKFGSTGVLVMDPGSPAAGPGGNVYDGGILAQGVSGAYQVCAYQIAPTTHASKPEWGPITELVLRRTTDQATNLQRLSLTAMADWANPGLSDAATDYRLQQEASGTQDVLDMKVVSQKNSTGWLVEFIDFEADGTVTFFRRTDSPANTGDALEVAIGQLKRGTANVLTSNGTQDSPALRLFGASYDGSLHTANWRQYVDVTSNAGASIYVLDTRIDSASWDPKLKISSGGQFLLNTSTAVAVSEGETPHLQLNGTDSKWGVGLCRFSADAQSAGIYMGKSRNAAVGSNTIVQSGDELGRITFSGDDGTDLNTIAARIQAFVDETPGANDMPGRLVFSTTPNGSANPIERMLIDNAGRVGIANKNSFDVSPAGTGQYPQLGIWSTGTELIQSTTGMFSADTTGCTATFIKSRAATIGTNTIVQSGDSIGGILWRGADGATYRNAAKIEAFVDGTPGVNDMPGRLVFSTTTDGSGTLAERLRLNSSGGAILANGTAIPAGGTAGLGYMVSSTSNFGVFFGSGAPSLSAAKGSLYLRSDGSTTNDRMYVNTDGSTTWTAVTTAA